jgi:hypothetical protein
VSLLPFDNKTEEEAALAIARSIVELIEPIVQMRARQWVSVIKDSITKPNNADWPAVTVTGEEGE